MTVTQDSRLNHAVAVLNLVPLVVDTGFTRFFDVVSDVLLQFYPKILPGLLNLVLSQSPPKAFLIPLMACMESCNTFEHDTLQPAVRDRVRTKRSTKGFWICYDISNKTYD